MEGDGSSAVAAQLASFLPGVVLIATGFYPAEAAVSAFVVLASAAVWELGLFFRDCNSAEREAKGSDSDDWRACLMACGTVQRFDPLNPTSAITR